MSDRIATITFNPSLDLESSVEKLVPTRKLRSSAPRRCPGGGGINVARAASRLGGDVVAVFPVGSAPGEVLHGLLQEEGVPDRPIPTREWTRQNVTILDESSSKQYRFVMPGPALSDEELDGCVTALFEEEAGYVVASGSLPRGAPGDLYAQMARRCAEGERRMVLDASGEALRRTLDVGVFLVKPNARELGELVGTTIADPLEAAEAGRKIVDEGLVEGVLVSLAEQGAVLVSREGAYRVIAPAVAIRSAVGAGDSMVGAITAILARGDTLLEAARLGVAAGTAATMTSGSELCRVEDVAEVLMRVSFEEL